LAGICWNTGTPIGFGNSRLGILYRPSARVAMKPPALVAI